MWPELKASDSDLDRAVNSMKHVEMSFSAMERRRLAIRCRESAAASQVPAWIVQLKSLFLYHLPQRAAATALGVVLLVTISVFFLPSLQRLPSDTAGRASDVQLVSIRSVSQGGVLLEWRDGDQEKFWVLKSSNPRDFSKAERHEVVGTRWMDLDPYPGQVTYYRVE